MLLRLLGKQVCDWNVMMQQQTGGKCNFLLSFIKIRTWGQSDANKRDYYFWNYDIEITVRFKKCGCVRYYSLVDREQKEWGTL
jgi:hypothetical protein